MGVRGVGGEGRGGLVGFVVGLGGRDGEGMFCGRGALLYTRNLKRMEE
jgi:hypothetical protein